MIRQSSSGYDAPRALRALLAGRTGRILLVASFAVALTAGIVDGVLRWQELRSDAGPGGGYYDALRHLGISADLYARYFIGSEALSAVAFALTAVIVAWRGTGPARRLAAMALVLYGVAIPPPMHSLVVDIPGVTSDDALHTALAFVRSMGTALFIILLYVFPDGRFATRSARVLGIAVLAWAMLWPWPPFHVLNPYRLPPPWPFVALTLLFASGIAFQVDHFNRLTAVQRQQTKWAVFGLIAAVAGDFVTHAPWTFHLVHKREDDLIALFVHQPFFIAAQMLIPLTIALSMLRKLLWKVDLVVSKTVLYAVSTTCVAAVWASVNAVVEAISKESISGAASATLVSGLAFKPLYTLIEDTIENRFRPGSFDVASEFPELTSEIRGDVPLTRLLRVLVEHTARLVNARHAAVYLFQEDGACWAAAEHALPHLDAVAQIPRMDALRARLDGGHALRLGEADEYAPLAVPLTLPRGATCDLIGVLALGRCGARNGYTAEDIVALENLGEQAGTAIYLARLKAT